MKLQRTLITTIVCVPLVLCVIVVAQTETNDSAKSERKKASDYSRQINENSPTTIVEARGRARILHETLHGTLQVMHRDFFREDEGLKIPSRSLEDVFRELERSYGVELRWLAVDTKAMDIDHEARDEFEKEAVRVLRSGKSEYENSTENRYRHAGRIRLSATCLTCHASRRSSNDDRFAGLVITMPLKPKNEKGAADSR